MKIKDVVDILNKNTEYCEKIVALNNKIKNLNYLDCNGKLFPFVEQQVNLGTSLDTALLDYDKKVLKYNKPKLDEVITEYKNWLEQEI